MIKGCSLLRFRSSRLTCSEVARFASTSSFLRTVERHRKSALFEDEKKRQRAAIGRIEKIEVKFTNWEEKVTLLMNKNLSTPHDCALHISQGTAELSALALVNGEVWDMHKPLEEACELQLSTMRTPANKSVNNAFWRTCSLVLGSVIENAFKDDIEVHLHSFLGPHLKSGSFMYDAQMGLEDWRPTNAEMKALSSLFVKVARARLPVERLVVEPNLALDMFRANPHKSKQIPDIASSNDNKIVLYRIGDYVDISKGPVVGNTSLIGRSTIAAVHKIHTDDVPLYRFQGVAIPAGILLNHFRFDILVERAAKLNQTVWMPHEQSDEIQENLVMAANN